MLIGQIEQEILEGRFWFYWLQAQAKLPASEQQIDLQQHETAVAWQLRRSESNQPGNPSSSDKNSQQGFEQKSFDAD